MKQDTHPTIYKEATVSCTGCKTVYQVPSTVESMTVEICAKCHPFYTGEHKFVDTMGRVEKFKQRTVIAEKAIAEVTKKTEEKNAKVEAKKTAPKTLKEMMTLAREELK